MWIILITCISQVCEPMPLNIGVFGSRHACEQAIIEAYRGFKPGRGAYTFNCTKVL